jgi:hypothetical protein
MSQEERPHASNIVNISEIAHRIRALHPDEDFATIDQYVRTSVGLSGAGIEIQGVEAVPETLAAYFVESYKPSTLETTVSDPAQDSLIDELVSDERYTHAVAGNFGVGYNHSVHEVRGPLKGNFIFDVYAKECGYELLEPSGPEFKARVWSRGTEDFPDSWMFHLAFNDRQGQDTRDGVNTSYTLVVPKSEAERVKAAVTKDPSVLIGVFQKVFQDYDRSNGTLSIDQVRMD